MELDHQYLNWLISINKIIVIYYLNFNNKVSLFAGVIVHLFLSKKMLVYFKNTTKHKILEKQSTTQQNENPKPIFTIIYLSRKTAGNF